MTSTNPKATTSSPDKPFRILSCDGGGLHGVLSLCALVKFEEETGKSCHDLFDLFAGTSTGSIIAGAIAAGMSATQVLEIYEKQGAEIFSRSEQCILLPWTFITKPKYSNKPLLKILHQHLGDRNIHDPDFPKRVLICAKDLRNGKNVFFNNNEQYKPEKYAAFVANNENRERFGTLYKIITASTAVTPIFPPYDDFVDGGIGIYANPVYEASLEAIDYLKMENITVHSIGTGIFGDGLDPKEIKSKNNIDWLTYWVTESLADTTEQQSKIVARYLEPRPGFSLRRYNFNLQRMVEIGKLGHNEMKKLEDAHNPAYIPELKKIGTELAAQMSWNSKSVWNIVPASG